MYDRTTLSANPFAANTMHPFTRAQNHGLYEIFLERYRNANILKFYGLNVAQFFALPHDIAQKILRDSEKAAKALTEALNNPGLNFPEV